MSEIILIIVIIVLCGLLGWEKRENKIERSKFINAILAKNATELANLEFVEKIKPPDTKVEDPLIPTSDMGDDEFDEHIKEVLKEDNG